MSSDMGSVSDPKLNWEESGCKRDLSRFANVLACY